MGRCEVASWSGRANNEHGASSFVLYRSTLSAHENRRVKSSYEGKRNIQRSVAVASDPACCQWVLLHGNRSPNVLTSYFRDMWLSQVMRR